MKSKKGFTLVELLVVIVILGIVTAISIPVIRNVQTSMTEKKYTAYYDSMKSSAKLYNDSYGEDMFGNNKVGVYCLKFSELESKKLIKDINIDKVSCNRENTFVRVTKLDDKYAYAPFLACGKDGGTDINFTLPEKNKVANMEDQFCGTSSEGTLEVVLADGYDEIKDPYRNNTYTKKRREARITIRSVGGINNTWLQNGRAIDLLYRWVDKEDGSHTEWDQLTFKTESREKQDQKMMIGKIIESTSEGKLYTPTGGDGPYKLEIRVNRFQDWFQNNWKASDDGNIVSFETYAVDNTKPIIDESKFKVVSTNNKYNDLKVKIPLNASDNRTSPNKLKVCVTTSSTECNPTTSYEEPVPYTISGSYDGKEKTLTVYVKDLAGNITNRSIKYKVAIKHTLKYDSNGGSACANKSVIHNVNDGTKWGDLCAPSKTGYKFDGWYNGNTKVTKDTVVTGDLNVKAKWTPHTLTIRYKVNGGSVTQGSDRTWTWGVSNGYITRNGSIDLQKVEYTTGNIFTDNGLLNYNSHNFTLIRTGYSIPSRQEWVNPKNGNKYNQDTKTYKISNFCDISKNDCTVELNANWSINSYTLRYDDNGGSGCSSKSITKEYNNAWGTLCTPSKTGYNFTGWKSGTTTINSSSKATSNIKVSAQWSAKSYTLTIDSNGGSGCSGSITKTYGSDWGLNCTPGRTGHTFKSWTINPTKATGNGTAKANWEAKNGWELLNAKTPIVQQQWTYWTNGTRVADGWNWLPADDSNWYWYYFIDGKAHSGWLKDGGKWYYFAHKDLDGNSYKDCRMLWHDECRYTYKDVDDFREECRCFNYDGDGSKVSPGKCGN